MLKQEFREPAQYNAIIKAVANGANKINEISSKVGLESGLCSSYISKLVNLGIIKKEYPILEKNSKKTIYSLKDTMFKFWYRFVPDNISLIEMGQADAAYDAFENQITAYMGSVFEEISKQYLWKLNIEKKLSFMFKNAGRWWGNNPKKKSECEIIFWLSMIKNPLYLQNVNGRMKRLD